MRDGFEDLEPGSGNCAFNNFAKPAPNAEVLVNDHGGLRWLAGLIVEGNEIVKCRLGDYPEPRAERNVFLRPRVTMLSTTPTSTT